MHVGLRVGRFLYLAQSEDTTSGAFHFSPVNCRLLLTAMATAHSRAVVRTPFAKQEIVLLLRSYEAHQADWMSIVDTVKENLHILPENARKYYKTAGFKAAKERLQHKFRQLLSADRIEDEEIRELVDTIKQEEVAPTMSTLPDVTRRQPLSQDNVGRNQPTASSSSSGALDMRVSDRQTVAHSQTTTSSSCTSPTASSSRDSAASSQPTASSDRGAERPVTRATRVSKQPREPDRRERYLDTFESDSDEENRRSLHGSGDDQEEPVRLPKNTRRKRPNKKRNSKSLVQMARKDHRTYQKFMTKTMPKVLSGLGVSESDETDTVSSD